MSESERDAALRRHQDRIGCLATIVLLFCGGCIAFAAVQIIILIITGQAFAQ